MIGVFLQGWLAFVISWLSLTTAAIIFFWIFKSRKDSEVIATVTCLITLVAVFFLFCLPALDVFLYSSAKDSSGNYVEWALKEGQLDDMAKYLNISYYLSYSIILFLAFVLLPFSFLYVSSGYETIRKRTLSATKFTFVFILILIVLLLLGIFLKPNNVGESKDDKLKYLKSIFTSNLGEKGIYFIVGCISIIGLCVWISYMAYGLFAVPLYLLVPSPDGTERRQSAAPDGYRLLGDIGDDESIDRPARPRNPGCLKMSARAIQIITGIASLGFSLLIFIAVFITCLDKSMHSSGYYYGFTLEKSLIFNPVDALLTLLHKIYPLDIVLLGSIMVYFMVCGLYAIRLIGIRMAFIKLFDIRKGHTGPQALIGMSSILCLVVVSFSSILMNISPQYMTFGNQMYNVNNTVTICSSTSDECKMTRAATFYNGLVIEQPFFGVLFFVFNWCFIAVSILSIPIIIYRVRNPKVRSFLDHYDDDLDDVGAFSSSRAYSTNTEDDDECILENMN